MSINIKTFFHCLYCENSEGQIEYQKIEELREHLAVIHLKNYILFDIKNQRKSSSKCKFEDSTYLANNMVTNEERDRHLEAHNSEYYNWCSNCYQGPFEFQDDLLRHISFYHKEIIEMWVKKLSPKLNKTLEPIRKVKSKKNF